MKVTASKLCQDIYSILDQIIESGVPVVIERKGKTLRIIPDEVPSHLERLKKRKYINGDPDDLIHIDWSSEWSELKRSS